MARNYLKVEPDRYKLMNKHFTRGRAGQKIEFITIHHNAGVLSIDQIWQVWQTRQASAHYQITSSGEIGQLVNDSDTAWHAGNQWANRRSIGIEVSNSAGQKAGWPITDTAIRTAGRWAAALCFYYKLGRPQAGRSIRFHREFSSTSCPYHLAPGGKYNKALMNEAQRFYDELKAGRVNPDGTPKGGSTRAPAPAPVKPAEKLLDYPRDQVHQDTFYNCGPASVQTVIRAATKKFFTEAELGGQLRTHRGGTDYIGQFPAVLNRHIPGANYKHVDMPNDPPTVAQKEKLWADLTNSISAGFGVVANIVAPPSNYPRAVPPSTQNLAYGGGTVYHYVAVMGFAGEGRGRRVWLADSGFRPYGCWISFDQLATLIPPKGYAYATTPAPKPQGGFLMSLSDNEQRELLDKTRRIHHELTHEFQSRYAENGQRSTFRDTLIGFVLEADRKLEDMHKNQLPSIWRKLNRKEK